MANTSITEQREAAQQHHDAARQIIKGCSNWSDIHYKIVPRIAALLQERDEAATAMRDKCVEKVKAALADERRKWPSVPTEYELGQRAAFTYALSVLESLTLDQVKPGEM